MTSKICLSLKSLEDVNFNSLSKKARNIELRLDYINYNSLNINEISQLFDCIILKLKDISQLFEINERSNINNLSNNIILDIDFKHFKRYDIINNGNLIKNNTIVSLHNVKYNYLTKYITELKLLYKIYQYKYIKIVINDDLINYSKEHLINIYNQLKNSNFNKIIFFEGEKFVASRYHSLLLGAPFLYCSIDQSHKTGKGQPTLEEAIRMVNLLGCFCKNN